MKKAVYRRVGLLRPNAALGALAAAISACYAPEVFAAEGGVRQMDEVIVTARRRDEMAQDVPISMTVMTEDFLRNNNIGKVEDIGTKVPSLRVTQVGGSVNEPVITLRGQRQGEAAFNQDPAAPMYFNEIVMSPIQGANAGLYDLESLQVLKGPQGTLFGRNSTGGALMITSKRPGYKFGGYTELKVGNYDLYGFEGAVDVPLTEQITTRLVGRTLDRDGYQKNIADNALNGRDYRDDHSRSVRLSVNFDSDAFSNLTVLSYDENKTAAAVPVAGAGNASSASLGAASNFRAAVAEQNARGPWKIKANLDGEENIRNIFASNASEYDLSDDLTLKNVFGYRKVVLATATDTDGTDISYYGAYQPGGVVMDPRLSVIDTEFYSDELQLFGSAFNNSFDWIAGLYWSKMAGSEDKLTQQSPGRYDSGINNITNTSYGLFVEGTYAFTDEWATTIGARQSQEKRELSTQKWSDIARTACAVFAEGVVPTAAGAGAKAPGCERSVNETFDSTTWKASVNYTPQPGVLVYGSISTGFRAGGFNTRGNDDATLQPFDPENVMTYELGHKQDWDLGGMPVRSSVAVYFQNYEDIQNTVSFTEPSTGRLVTRTENAAKAEIKGLELEVSAKPTDNLTVALSYAYVDAQFKTKEDQLPTGFIPAAVPTPQNPGSQVYTTVNTSGNDFTYIPEQSVTSSVTYVLPLDPTLGDISVMASVYWQDEMSTHPFRDQFGILVNRAGSTWSAADVEEMTKFSTVDAYTVWNLRVDWRGVMGSTFDVAAYVDNITDEEYVQGGLNVVDTGGYGAYHYGAPRTLGASVKYSF